MRVHLIKRNGHIDVENFGKQDEAVNFARGRSTGHGTICAILQGDDDRLTFYEHGEKVDSQLRAKELGAIVEEIHYVKGQKAIRDGSKTRR